MDAKQGVDHLYDHSDEHRKSNANLPGNLVYSKTSLDAHAMIRDKQRLAIEDAIPGFEAGHIHSDCLGKCGKWNWLDYGIPNEYNPTATVNASYDWYSRAEAMKGSLQTVAIAQGMQSQRTIEGGSVEPNLTPMQRQTPGNTTVVMVGQAYKGAKKSGLVDASKKLVGLNGR